MFYCTMLSWLCRRLGSAEAGADWDWKVGEAAEDLHLQGLVKTAGLRKALVKRCAPIIISLNLTSFIILSLCKAILVHLIPSGDCLRAKSLLPPRRRVTNHITFEPS